MKVVLLVAGKGRRLNNITKNSHKSLIKLDEYTLLEHLIENFIFAGLTDFVPVVGHCSEQVLSCLNKKYSKEISVNPVYNSKYNESNNLYSLYMAKDILKNEDFIVCNADVIINREILLGMRNKSPNASLIAIDDFDYPAPIDSPGISMNNNTISDLGRHIPFKIKKGYAIGVYRFNKELSKVFFNEAKKLLDQNMEAGFHDPLQKLFNKHPIYKYSVQGYDWMDIDTFSDIDKARNMHQKIISKYKKINKIIK